MSLRRIIIYFFFLVFPLITLGEKEISFFPKNQLFFITSLLIFSLAIFESWKKRQALKFPLFFLPILLGALWALLSTISSDYYQPLSMVTTLANWNPELLFFFFWLVGSYNLFLSESDTNEASVYLLGGMAIPLIIGLFQYTQTFNFSLSPEEFRLFIFGTYPNPLVFATALLPTIFIGLNLSLKDSWEKRLGIVTTSSGLFLLLATLSRSVWLTGIVGIVLFGLINRHHLKSHGQTLIIVGSLFIGSLFLLYSPITNRIINTNSPSQSQTSVVRRLAIWESGLKTFLDHPIIGSGNNTFEVAVFKHRSSSLNTDPTLWESPFFPENFLLRSLAEHGLVGTIFLVSFFIGLVYAFYKRPPTPTIFPLISLLYGLTAFQAETVLFPLFVFISLIPLKQVANITFSLKLTLTLALAAVLILFFNLQSLLGYTVSPYPQTHLTFVNKRLLNDMLEKAALGYSVAPFSFHTQTVLVNRSTDAILWNNSKYTPSVFSSNYPPLLLAQSRLLIATNNFKDAKLTLDRVKLTNPNDPRLNNLYGVMEAKMGNLNEAETNFRKSIDLKQDYYPAIHNLGIVTKKTKYLDDSRQLFQKYYHFFYYPNASTFDY